MSGRDWVADVRAFHEGSEQVVNDVPTWPSAETMRLRFNLIHEELAELAEAVTAGDMVEVADAIADAIYVLIGTAVSMGIPLQAVWAEVHRSNMAKVAGGVVRNAAGKVTKPEGWTPPDIATLVGQVEPPSPEVMAEGGAALYKLLDEGERS